MSSDHDFDVAVFTVVPPELEAVQKVLAVNHLRDRLTINGTIHWTAQKYSALHDRQLKIIIGFTNCSSQADASVAVTKMIEKFNPAIVILSGIAAGWRSKLKIGDVIAPKIIADFSAVAAQFSFHPAFHRPTSGA